MARFCDSNQKRGVTLVELIVVLVILAVLAALLLPSLTGYIDKAVEKRIMLQARSLMTAAQHTQLFVYWFFEFYDSSNHLKMVSISSFISSSDSISFLYLRICSLLSTFSNSA